MASWASSWWSCCPLSFCPLHCTLCIPAPCSPSSNSHILSLLGIMTVVCVSPYPMHPLDQLLFRRYKHSLFSVSYAVLCCIYYVLHRLLRSNIMTFFAVHCVWIRQGLAYPTHTCVQSSHSKTAHRLLLHCLSYWCSALLTAKIRCCPAH